MAGEEAPGTGSCQTGPLKSVNSLKPLPGVGLGSQGLETSELYLTLDWALVELPSVILGFCQPYSGGAK